MFATPFVARISDVSAAVSSFVRVKVSKRTFTPAGNRSGVTVVRIETIIHVAVETTRPVKPGTCPDERTP